MKYSILDIATDEVVAVVEAASLEAAEQEASCYSAETGRDREFEYEGYAVFEGEI